MMNEPIWVSSVSAKLLLKISGATAKAIAVVPHKKNLFQFTLRASP